MWFQKKVLPLQANICTTMSLTQIIGNVFKPRQKALEKHLNEGEALQHVHRGTVPVCTFLLLCLVG